MPKYNKPNSNEINPNAKLIKALGKDTVEELNNLTPEDLKARIVQSSQAMQEVKDQLDANPKYTEAKEAVSALSGGKRDVDKRQKAIIKYALSLLANA